MSSIPIKTGMTVFFPEYGNKFLRADMYRVGTAYVFVGSVFYSDNPDETFDVEVRISGNSIIKELVTRHNMVVVPDHACIIHNKELAQ